MLISTSTSPSPAIGISLNQTLDSNFNIGGTSLNTSNSSDMKGKYIKIWTYSNQNLFQMCQRPRIIDSLFLLILGILGIKRGRKKEKKTKKSSACLKDEEMEHSISKDTSTVGSDGEEVQKSVSPTPDVDEEGYSKPPPNASRIGMNEDDPWADFNRQSNFGSSSDDSGKIYIS